MYSLIIEPVRIELNLITIARKEITIPIRVKGDTKAPLDGNLDKQNYERTN